MARRTLAEVYDRPLLRLFQYRLKNRPADAEDWKQDFIISHFLTGKIFEHAKPTGHFHSYLARAVHNYIVNRREAELAQCRRPTNAEPFSKLSGENQSIADSVADPLSLEEDEHLLTHERALDVIDTACEGLLQWARSTSNPESIAAAERLKNGDPSLAGHQAKMLPGALASKFKDLLRTAVRDEVLVQPGEDTEEIIGREIKLLRDALQRKKLGTYNG
ncbi:MAG TPA: hypothetical protein VG722_12410 [Tepidisphaeraceae bacterium]|nr:hypothetical protein [Tepidisphaeraceae bacterium]